MKFDLHCHSLRSDGTMLPRDVVARAAQRGVDVLSLTDHDEITGLAEARGAALEFGIRLIDGVEISVTWQGCTVHIVGLGIKPDDVALQTGLASIRNGRHGRAIEMAAAFDQMGIAGTLEGARKFALNPDLIGRAHFARFLVEQGVVKNMDRAFKRFLGGGQPCFVPLEWARLADAVAWIRGSGGVAVIAHPGRYPIDAQAMQALISEFKDVGGEAIEVVCGSHKANHVQIYARYAQRFGLLASSGSDFHDPRESHFDLGSMPVLPESCTPVWSRLH